MKAMGFKAAKKAILAALKEGDYQHADRNQIKNVECHVIKAQGWYIKFYFLDPATFFISVHQWGSREGLS